MKRVVLLALGSSLLVTGASSAGSAVRVLITDSALSPIAAVISPGGSVQWTNKGARQHRVKSAQGTFPAFTLQPGKSKVVKFERRGCERYEVDDRLNGRVLVGVSSCAGGTTPPPPSGGGGGGGGGGNKPPPPGGETTHRYSVKTIGSVEEVEDSYESNSPEYIGVVTRNASWKGTWAKMRVGVSNGEDLNIQGDSKGSMRSTFSYRDTRPAYMCSGTRGFSTKGTAYVSGWRGRRGDSSVGFDGRTGLLSPNLCHTANFVQDEMKAVVSGLAIMMFDQDALIAFERKGRGIFFPIDRLRDGKAFTVTTSRTISKVCSLTGSSGCRRKATWSASVVFTPTR